MFKIWGQQIVFVCTKSIKSVNTPLNRGLGLFEPVRRCILEVIMIFLDQPIILSKIT